ncbi:MAG: SDR family oxidoreductase [Candidatus Omnitrophica bacterium]|nr:SDR family oxidoreductase [Candidatus Omnitrophota bacterium]
MRQLKDVMNLKGRVAVITGGAGHIGFAAAESLSELGADIVLLDINTKESKKKAQFISRRFKVNSVAFEVDLAKEKEIKEVSGKIISKFGCIDILVNNAALVAASSLKGWCVSFEKQSSDSWRKAMEVNLTSVFILTQSCKEALSRSGHGSVINISSIYGIVGPDMKLYEGTNMGNPAAYAASKGGLIQLTRWLATVLAPSIRVNAISPGGVFRNHKEPFLSRYIKRTPLKRMATEEDLKGPIAYLASDLSSYVTGQNLVVDGGWTAW